MKPKTWNDRYSPDYLAGLDMMQCPDGEPRGARYCALCRTRYARQRRGADL